MKDLRVRRDSPCVQYVLVATSDRPMPADRADRLDATVLYREHADFVWRSLQHLGVRDADLEDVLQEVFVVVHRRLHTYDGTSRVTTWLFGICLRMASRYRRRAYFRWERHTDALPERADESSPESQCSERQTRAALERLLKGLSLERRAVFVLFELEGQSCPEIAELLGVPVGTVYSRLHAARKAVECALAKLNRSEQTGVTP